jgi:hypothetical protein
MTREYDKYSDLAKNSSRVVAGQLQGQIRRRIVFRWGVSQGYWPNADTAHSDMANPKGSSAMLITETWNRSTGSCPCRPLNSGPVFSLFVNNEGRTTITGIAKASDFPHVETYSVSFSRGRFYRNFGFFFWGVPKCFSILVSAWIANQTFQV